MYVKSKVPGWQRPWQGLIAEDTMSVTTVMGSGGWAVINTLGKHQYLAMSNWSQDHGTELDGQTNPFFLNLGNRKDDLLVGEFIPDLGVGTMDHHEFSPISRLETIYSLIILGGEKGQWICLQEDQRYCQAHVLYILLFCIKWSHDHLRGSLWTGEKKISKILKN